MVVIIILLALLVTTAIWGRWLLEVYNNWRAAMNGKLIPWEQVRDHATRGQGTIVVNDSGYQGNGTWWSPRELTPEAFFCDEECEVFRTNCPLKERDVEFLRKTFPNVMVLHIRPSFM